MAARTAGTGRSWAVAHRATWTGWPRAALRRTRSVGRAAGQRVVGTSPRRGRWSRSESLGLRRCGSRSLLLSFFGVLPIPAPDGPVVRATILLAFQIEAGDRLKDLQPVAGIPTDLDLGARGPKGVEGLVEQVAHHASLWLGAGRADTADREVVVDPHVAFDEASQSPGLGRPVVAFQDENVPTRRGAPIALAAALVVGVSQGAADRFPQRRGVVDLGGANAISQTTFFHGACCRTA